MKGEYKEIGILSIVWNKSRPKIQKGKCVGCSHEETNKGFPAKSMNENMVY